MGSLALVVISISSLNCLLPIWDAAMKVSVSSLVLRCKLKLILLHLLVRTENVWDSENSGPRS